MILFAALAIAATVNGEPITVREFERQALQLRALIFDEFHRRHAVEDGPAFWETPYEGARPQDILFERALSACVRIKIQQLLARREGLTDEISYAAFLSRLNAENARRRAAAARGEPVYGPVVYGEDEYYAHTLRLLAEWLRRRLGLSEADYDARISGLAREANVAVNRAGLARVRLR